MTKTIHIFATTQKNWEAFSVFTTSDLKPSSLPGEKVKLLGTVDNLEQFYEVMRHGSMSTGAIGRLSIAQFQTKIKNIMAT